MISVEIRIGHVEDHVHLETKSFQQDLSLLVKKFGVTKSAGMEEMVLAVKREKTHALRPLVRKQRKVEDDHEQRPQNGHDHPSCRPVEKKHLSCLVSTRTKYQKHTAK